MFLASSGGHVEVVKALLDAEADVHACDNRALCRASYKGHVEVVKTLLDAGDGEALRLAVEYGRTEVIKLLVADNFDTEDRKRERVKS